MAQRITPQFVSALDQAINTSQRTQRRQVDVAAQPQYKLTQKTGFNASESHSNSRHSDQVVASANLNHSSLLASHTAAHSSAKGSAVASSSFQHQLPNSVDDSMLLNLLKQIVDSEFHKNRSSIASQDNSISQVDALQHQRDAVFGVLRSAIDVAHLQSDLSHTESHQPISTRPETFQSSSKVDTVQPIDTSLRRETAQPISTLLQQASLLAKIISRIHSDSTKRTNFVSQDWIRMDNLNGHQILWRIVNVWSSKVVQFQEQFKKDVGWLGMFASLQENDYGTAPIWYQQDMENGPPQLNKLVNLRELGES